MLRLLRRQCLAPGQLALQELRLRQDDRQWLLHIVADRGNKPLLLCQGGCHDYKTC
jgi:hypothetical protein